MTTPVKSYMITTPHLINIIRLLFADKLERKYFSEPSLRLSEAINLDVRHSPSLLREGKPIPCMGWWFDAFTALVYNLGIHLEEEDFDNIAAKVFKDYDPKIKHTNYL